MKSVATALAKRGIAPTLIFTGQHPRLEPAEFGLGDFPRVSLGCPGKEEVFPFGDGRAAPRIAEIIDRWLEERSLTRRLA